MAAQARGATPRHDGRGRRGGRRLGLTAAAAVLALTAACTGGSTEASDDGATVLRFTWWGDTSRADRYEEAVALFEDEYPGVDVRTGFASWGDYWTARSTEAAAGGLPDVLQMDLAYLTEYASTGRIAPLDEHLGEAIDVDALPEQLLPAAQVEGETFAIPTSTNTLALQLNTALLGELGVPAPEGDLTWDEYDALLASVAAAGAGREPAVHGSVDYTQIFWLFQVWLGQQGKAMFEDGGFGFTREDLAAWWGRSPALHASDAFLPPERLAQLEGVDALGIGEAAADISWDNFLVRYSEGSASPQLVLLPPPADDPQESGLFLKPSLMLSVGASSAHPEEAAALIDFLTNDPRVGEIFGMSRGVPASTTALDGVEPTGLDAQILEYERALEPRLTSSPPPPVAGFGTLEAAFTTIGQELGYGNLSVEDAVDEWFAEADLVLGG
ncbi:ABC transporter substrate-binding protein [Cellulomonas sp. NPDC057328]|uniref:ABC transporter substrate-binding protein n=1 Tax=Cellulomonas sp. NPDC057328 TaxID=3346101 RepID=UPI0036455C2D